LCIPKNAAPSKSPPPTQTSFSNKKLPELEAGGANLSLGIDGEFKPKTLQMVRVKHIIPDFPTPATCPPKRAFGITIPLQGDAIDKNASLVTGQVIHSTDLSMYIPT
jgi:hypothetical protein